MSVKDTLCLPQARRMAFAVAAAALLTGCAEWTSRQETVGFNAGDAVAANKALQIIDRWDRRAGHTKLPQDGNRAVTAIDTYREGGADGDSDDGSTTINIGGGLTTGE